MKTEQSILILISLAFLAVAIFTSYNTPMPKSDLSSIEYLADMENYKREVADRISVDNRRIAALDARFEIEKSEGRRDYEKIVSMLKGKINGVQTKLNKYKANGLDEWESFKKKIDHDLDELNQSFQELTVKKPTSHDNNLSPRVVKP